MIAKGFGLRSTNVTDISQIEPLFKAYQAQDKAEIGNFQVSDKGDQSGDEPPGAARPRQDVDLTQPC